MRRVALVSFLLLTSCASGSHYARVSLSKAPEGRGNKSGSGVASFYATGRRTANGERFLPEGLTVAHKTLPFGTIVLFTNPLNHRSAKGRVNDRGPFVKGRVFDVSKGLARELGFISQGTARLIWEIVK